MSSVSSGPRSSREHVPANRTLHPSNTPDHLTNASPQTSLSLLPHEPHPVVVRSLLKEFRARRSALVATRAAERAAGLPITRIDSPLLKKMKIRKAELLTKVAAKRAAKRVGREHLAASNFPDKGSSGEGNKRSIMQGAVDELLYFNPSNCPGLLREQAFNAFSNYTSAALECPICFEVMADRVVTSCGHTFCRLCADQLRINKLLERQAGCSQRGVGDHDCAGFGEAGIVNRNNTWLVDILDSVGKFQSSEFTTTSSYRFDHGADRIGIQVSRIYDKADRPEPDYSFLAEPATQERSHIVYFQDLASFLAKVSVHLENRTLARYIQVLEVSHGPKMWLDHCVRIRLYLLSSGGYQVHYPCSVRDNEDSAENHPAYFERKLAELERLDQLPKALFLMTFLKPVLLSRADTKQAAWESRIQ
ncbi:hypothetical protein N431DRAFT_509930 [Stipitochalara longipes BDJ]|nr:hypothetical protein N431DRAFT_509930 [Stipitochalara longipes BDJ]